MGGSFWTASVWSWPFAHFLVCDDRLILTTPEGTFDFPRERVVRLRYRPGWFARALKLGFGGLQIEHSVADYPPFIFFGSFNISSVCNALRDASFAIAT